jgi:hypothetical protein
MRCSVTTKPRRPGPRGHSKPKRMVASAKPAVRRALTSSAGSLRAGGGPAGLGLTECVIGPRRNLSS